MKKRIRDFLPYAEKLEMIKLYYDGKNEVELAETFRVHESVIHYHLDRPLLPPVEDKKSEGKTYHQYLKAEKERQEIEQNMV